MTPEDFLRTLAEQVVTALGDVFYTPDPAVDGYTADDLHQQVVDRVAAALAQALDLPVDTAEQYAAVYWTVDDLVDPGCNGLAVNWGPAQAAACLNDLQGALAQVMCEPGREYLEIWVPRWARQQGVPDPIPYDAEAYDADLATDNYDDFDPGDDYAGDDYDGGW